MVQIKMNYRFGQYVNQFSYLNVPIYELIGFKIVIVFSKWVDNEFPYLQEQNAHSNL